MELRSQGESVTNYYKKCNRKITIAMAKLFDLKIGCKQGVVAMGTESYYSTCANSIPIHPTRASPFICIPHTSEPYTSKDGRPNQWNGKRCHQVLEWPPDVMGKKTDLLMFHFQMPEGTAVLVRTSFRFFERKEGNKHHKTISKWNY
ncbi:hypothetical protein TNIN_167561 [Trichonephila inaurata madagascariensis]|uniref:Uncharacterized protein n=1 Tax=Trichonephila inaurata madagascariensis TaxID=2747483 RepID=A0A8X7CK32_9ARAC|nr:hypothetical protein TNIN_167561 [Trichonephila inaurata madagascariensis]